MINYDNENSTKDVYVYGHHLDGRVKTRYSKSVDLKGRRIIK